MLISEPYMIIDYKIDTRKLDLPNIVLYVRVSKYYLSFLCYNIVSYILFKHKLVYIPLVGYSLLYSFFIIMYFVKNILQL